MINIIRIIAGLALLTLGRKLFWLFVAIIGFAFGFLLADRFFPRQAELVQLAIALAFGLVGALLAVFLQKLAIYVAGFIAGGSILVTLLEILGARVAPGIDFFIIIIFIIGGVIGAVLVMLIFDWALIILSSFAGAGFVVPAVFPAVPTLDTILFIILLLVGVVIQALMMRGEHQQRPAER
jgi:uncharacterized protein DUF4203